MEFKPYFRVYIEMYKTSYWIPMDMDCGMDGKFHAIFKYRESHQLGIL